MFCSQCGAQCADGQFCNRCGAPLNAQKAHADVDSYQIPQGKFDTVGSCLQLHNDALDLHNYFAFGKKMHIPYAQITQVLYARPDKKLSPNGYLIIRFTQNRNKPIPRGYRRRFEKCGICFGFTQDLVFYHIFRLLKTLATTAEFQMELPPQKIPHIHTTTDEAIDALFARFSPNRQQAAAALCRQCNISLAAATEIIDTAFDNRQNALYTAEPKAAVRDLNRAILICTCVPNIYASD